MRLPLCCLSHPLARGSHPFCPCPHPHTIPPSDPSASPLQVLGESHGRRGYICCPQEGACCPHDNSLQWSGQKGTQVGKKWVLNPTPTHHPFADSTFPAFPVTPVSGPGSSALSLSKYGQQTGASDCTPPGPFPCHCRCQVYLAGRRGNRMAKWMVSLLAQPQAP